MSTIRCSVVLLLCLGWLPAWAASPAAGTNVLPQPVVEKVTGKTVILARKAESIGVALPERTGAPIAEGMNLLKRRAAALGYKLVACDTRSSQIALARCSEETLTQLLKSHGIEEKLEANRLSQAYHITVESSSTGKPLMAIRAAHDWGLFYGLVSLCQLLDVDDAGNLCVPAVEILDFPEIAHRLAKTGAEAPPDLVERFAAWLPLYKISQVGLQYHGKNSKNPEPDFTTNIKTLCPRLRRAGTLESIVYFCPFRGQKDKKTGRTDGAYDFPSAADKAAYGDYLLWIMAQGAHGIEVDYNDWPGSSEVPISDVLNLAYEKVKKQYPDAYVLYCPPARGKESYRGMPTPDLRQTLSRVPPGVWPLWTGPYTLIREPLPAAQVETWTKEAGRRPFLWLNRVALEVKESFSNPVPGLKDRRVFAGDRLPKELNRLFEGVHFNAGLSPGGNKLPGDFDPRSLAYLATAADYVWNPHKWEPAESYRRAVRFVEVMRPLLNDESSTQTAPSDQGNRARKQP